MPGSDFDNTQTSRARLLGAGKMLFSKLGYEQTSTSAICREAGTSESQLMRYFGGKSGLLEAIFNESWSGLNDAIRARIAAAEHSRDAVIAVLGLVNEAFGNDHEVASIFLFEGRRIRGHEVVLSKGFQQFYELIQDLIRRGQSDGSFRTDVSEIVLSSALLGAAEGMVRDRMILERMGTVNVFDDEAIGRVFGAIVSGLAAPRSGAGE